jgi:tRNA pseudouridine38-40 synthase
MYAFREPQCDKNIREHAQTMARFRLTIEYEGTRYSGWQRQKNARTVQGELEQSLREGLELEAFEFQGAGRTDAGVHAVGQVAHLEAAIQVPTHVVRFRMNDALPADINVLAVAKADPRFHARHHAFSRTYLYQIARRRTALGKRFVWWVKDDLDSAAMRKAAGHFVGLKDFRSFTKDDPDEKSTKVFLSEFIVREAGDLILMRVTGSHFLWKSVRRMVGALVEVGRGSIQPDALRRLLHSNSQEISQFTAPPSGLFLEHIQYDENEVLHAPRPVFPLPAAGT